MLIGRFARDVKRMGTNERFVFSHKFAPLSSLRARTIKELLVSGTSLISSFEENISPCWMFSLTVTKPGTESTGTRLKTILSFRFVSEIRHTMYMNHIQIILFSD